MDLSKNVWLQRIWKPEEGHVFRPIDANKMINDHLGINMGYNERVISEVRNELGRIVLVCFFQGFWEKWDKSNCIWIPKIDEVISMV